MMLAIIRTSDWETPLFLHVLGAMLLVGGLFVVAVALTAAWRAEEGNAIALTRFAYRMLFVVVLPAFIAMRIGAQWVLDESPFDEDQSWVGIGFLVSDVGAILLLVSLVLAGLGLRRTNGSPGGVSARVVTIVTLVLLAAYVVTIWAMTTKPT
jgi:uncharacterized membrane protein